MSALRRFFREIESTSKAMLQAGAKDLNQALVALPDSIKPVDQPGMPLNPTPQEVFNDKMGARQQAREMER